MELIRGLHNLKPRHRGCAATIGNFDGVHRGHLAVLDQLREQATALGLPDTVICFEPTPQEYFAPRQAPPRLSRLREKLGVFRDHGVERVLCLRFGPRLAELDADAFIERVLVQGLGVRYLVVGDDFRFGKGRRGDFALLAEAGERHGFPVVATATFSVDGQRVSSTRVREALAAGDLALAERLLGRPYCISGRVAPGDRRGRDIGFPTANIHLHRVASPLRGVFAVRMLGVDDQPRPGVANLGTRPTVDGTHLVLEVHLFDFDGDLYGRHVDVEFVRRLRDERKFESFDALKEQIQLDARAARAVFAVTEA